MEGSDEVRSRDELLCSVDRTKLPPMLHIVLPMENKQLYTCACICMLPAKCEIWAGRVLTS